MKNYSLTLALGGLILGAFGLCEIPVRAGVVFEETTPYHHIRVTDQLGVRMLLFDNATESRMFVDDPLKGHFEYTEYFHMPWLWNDQIKTVLMLGLGGATTSLAWQHYYSNVVFEVVELDPKVVQVAKNYFHFQESPNMRVHVEDGRVFLRRSQKKYDVILMDAYTANRYGSFIPYSLVTKEFFTLVNDHLTTNGVLAYNVIGTTRSEEGNIVGALYTTIKTVFPQVYYFPANSSQNVVLLATKWPQASTLMALNQKLLEMNRNGWVSFPTFKSRLQNFRALPPPAAARSRLLTDNFAPTDGLLSTGQ